MSMYFKEHGDYRKLEYGKSMTKQSFKDETNIEKILARAMVTGSLDHLAKHEASYGDFSDYDFHENQNMLARGGQIFDELPQEVKREFGNNVSEFFAFVNDPVNVGRLSELMPALAEPGEYFPDLDIGSPPGTTKEPTSVVEPKVEVEVKADETVITSGE